MNNHLLFSYGTLQLEKVQIETFGRILKGHSDKLMGYKLDRVEITDPDVLSKSEQRYHPIAFKSSYPTHYIDGVLFEITEKELLEADKYEVDDYERVLETFESGKKGWIYVLKKSTYF